MNKILLKTNIDKAYIEPIYLLHDLDVIIRNCPWAFGTLIHMNKSLILKQHVLRFPKENLAAGGPRSVLETEGKIMGWVVGML